MIVSIKNVNGGSPFTLSKPINNKDGKLKIGIKHIGLWQGMYNIREDQTGSYGDNNFTIEAGLYTFRDIATILKQLEGLEIVINKKTGLVEITSPNNLLLPKPVRNMLGFDDEIMQGEFIGDRVAEFLPHGGISIYLDELSTTNNFSSKGQDIIQSNLLHNIPILTDTFAQYFSLSFDNPSYVDLRADVINQLNFTLKEEWFNFSCILNNHKLPVSLTFEII